MCQWFTNQNSWNLQTSSQITTARTPAAELFTCRMPFMTSNHQCQSTEGKIDVLHHPAYSLLTSVCVITAWIQPIGRPRSWLQFPGRPRGGLSRRTSGWDVVSAGRSYTWLRLPSFSFPKRLSGVWTSSVHAFAYKLVASTCIDSHFYYIINLYLSAHIYLTKIA